MNVEVKFSLDPEGGADKSFLSGSFIERAGDGTVALGVAHRDGDGYAFSRISEAQFIAAVQMLFPEEFE